MAQETSRVRPKPDRRQILWTLAATVPLMAAAGVLVAAVDTRGAGRDGLGSAIVALVTGVSSAEADIVSMPLLWAARVLVVLSIIADVFLIRYLFTRPRE